MLVFKKEKEARKLVLGHLKTVHECLTETRGALEEYVAGNTASVGEKRGVVSQLESTADSQMRELREVLLAGAFLPHIRSDVYRLAGAVDDLANKAESIARFVCDQPPMITDDLKPDLIVLYQHAMDTFAELHEALKNYFKPKGVYENLHVHVTRVSELESEVDQIESKLVSKIFSSELELGQKLHLKQLVNRAASIADLSEDAADELEFAAMKAMV